MKPLGDRAARHHRTYGPLLVGAVVLGLLGPAGRGLARPAQPVGAAAAHCRPARSAGSSTTCAASTPATWSAACCRRTAQVTTDATITANMPGAIPIPATLSIELGNRISAHDGAVKYRFVSDLPFKGRERHHARRLRAAARSTALRADPEPAGGRGLRLAARPPRPRSRRPVRDGRGLRRAATTRHPDSPKTRLEGRRRARHPGDLGRAAASPPTCSSFKYLLALFRPRGRWRASTFILLQRRQAAADPRHQPGADRRPTISSPRSR